MDEGASDLHLAVGLPPVLRIHGALQPLDADPLRPEDTERLMKSITSEDHTQKVREQGGTDFGFGFGDVARFRVSVFKQKGHIGLVLRLIPSRLMSLEEIGLPAQIKDLLFKPRGLILVTGPTGSGKTTTLASMINIINEERDCHIITIEDPIEYYHAHKRSVVTQREIGVDVPTFKEALRRGLRQDPDVILVGEMRDLETMEAAITAAETGHLVFATLHTTGAARTVDRIVDAFPDEPAGADPHAAFVQHRGGDLPAPAGAQGQAGPHRRLRNHDRHAVHPGADPRQQDVPHHVGHPDRRAVGHDDARRAPDGAVRARPDHVRGSDHEVPGSGGHRPEAGNDDAEEVTETGHG